MAQSPFKADAFQIEPAATGTRTISRDATTNSLKFVDPSYPSGVLLSDLVGLQSLDTVAVVGTNLSTIQEAIDAADDTVTVPVILVPAGLYEENLTINKNIVITGIGRVVISSPSVDPVVTITQTNPDAAPEMVHLSNLTLVNAEDGGVCVLIDGSNTFATGSITVDGLLSAGDTIVIGGFTLTGVAGPRTSGQDDFDASLGTVNALATEIAAALNDEDNSFAGLVEASALGATITTDAFEAGSGGNAITLVTTGVNLSLSGATLTGGGGVDSETGLDEIQLLNCDIVASGVGGYQVDAQFVNNIMIRGGSWFVSSSTSQTYFSQVANVILSDIDWMNDVQSSYLTSLDLPASPQGDLVLHNCRRVGNVITNHEGGGEVTFTYCGSIGNVTVNGDRDFTASWCLISDILIEDTVSARLVDTRRNSLGGAGTPTVMEKTLVLQDSVVAAVSATVTFDRDQPDTNYFVSCDVPTAGVVANVTSKTVTGFTVTFSAPVTGVVFYLVNRQM